MQKGFKELILNPSQNLDKLLSFEIFSIIYLNMLHSMDDKEFMTKNEFSIEQIEELSDFMNNLLKGLY